MTVYDIVTEKIIDSISKGVMPWECPWSKEAHHNADTGRNYTGMNTLLLEASCHQNFYGHRRWMTMKQAGKNGLRVAKGSKSTLITFFTMMQAKKAKKADKDDKATIPVLRYYRVFNVQDLTGDDVSNFIPVPVAVDKSSIFKKAEEFVSALKEAGLNLQDGVSACYSPSEDVVRLPPKGLFSAKGKGDEALENWYATLFHEIGHWTGAKKRLDRKLSKGRFGDKAYAMEELVAELTASYLCADLGLPYQTQHADYIGSWVAVLAEDNKAIFTASRFAQNAAKWLYESISKTSEVDRAANT